MEIREYIAADARAVNDLIRGIQRLEQGLELEQPELWKIDTFYQSTGNFWVAVDERTLIGTVGLQLLSNGVAKLGKMFVASSHRGRHRGVAAALLDAAVAWARDQGVTTICLETIVERCAAHSFYLKHGFTEVAAHELPSAFKTCPHPSRYFIREL